MTTIDHGPRLDEHAVERILAPFGRIDGLGVSLQDADGRTLVGPPAEAGSGAPRMTRDLRASGTTVGRLVAEGPAVTDRTVAAALEALAVALEDLAGSVAGMPSSADRRGRPATDDRGSPPSCR